MGSIEGPLGLILDALGVILNLLGGPGPIFEVFRRLMWAPG